MPAIISKKILCRKRGNHRKSLKPKRSIDEKFNKYFSKTGPTLEKNSVLVSTNIWKHVTLLNQKKTSILMNWETRFSLWTFWDELKTARATPLFKNGSNSDL